MRVLHLALIAAFLAPAVASAQTTAERMLATAKQIRATAEQLKGSLSPADHAQLVKQAEDIEQGVRDGAYAAVAAPKAEAPLSERLMAAHGRLDWLTPKTACAGYTPENYTSFRYSAGINARDTHCRNAYGHWATYLQASRNGDSAEESEKALFYYDAAAQRAMGLSGGR